MQWYDFYTETDMEGVVHHRIIADSEVRAFEFLLESGYNVDEITRLSMGVDNNGDCAEYCEFLKKLKRIHKKVDSSDLSDFTELKVERGGD
jgi:hypothetical protein